jgi:hypothetical protein
MFDIEEDYIYQEGNIILQGNFKFTNFEIFFATKTGFSSMRDLFFKVEKDLIKQVSQI